MAGGGVKINNISVLGGANGKTPTFALGESISQTSGHLYNSYDNGVNWHDLGQVKGADGVDGEDGINGINGVDGATPLFKIQNGYLYNSYDGGETWESLGYVRGNDGADGAGTNPNLLINSNFAINQRGQSSYTANKYTVDRWYIGANATLTVGTNNISITTTVASSLQQRMELPFGKLASRTVTISAKMNGVVYSESGEIGSTQPSGTNETAYINKRINENSINGYLKFVWDASTSLFKCYFYFSNAQTVAFDWFKLEIGDTATGYTPPLVAEELPKCQRYYREDVLYAQAKSTYSLYQSYIHFSIPMRTMPTTKIYSYHYDSQSQSYIKGSTEGTVWNVSDNTEISLDTTARGLQYVTKYGGVVNSIGKFVADKFYYMKIESDAEL